MSAVPQRSNVLIICTGGTLGMFERDDGSLEPRTGAFTSMLPAVFSFNQGKLPRHDVIEWDPLIDSSNMRPELWKVLIKQIRDHYDDYDGFLVLMGTDTMSYTASCISFAFDNLAKPIIFTGSQIPLQRAYTDARRHLTIGLLAAGNLQVPEVGLMFGNSLFRANRSIKSDNWGVSAFESPNCQPLATFGVNVHLSDHIRPMPTRPLQVNDAIFPNILVVWLVPGFDDRLLTKLSPDGIDPDDVGIVLMLYGAGNAPTHSKSSFLKALVHLKANRAEIVVCSQCRSGSIDISAYATGQQMTSLALINGCDMTVEACVTKLSHLMGQGIRGPRLKSLMESDLRGELSPSDGHFSYQGLPWV